MKAINTPKTTEELKNYIEELSTEIWFDMARIDGDEHLAEMAIHEILIQTMKNFSWAIDAIETLY